MVDYNDYLFLFPSMNIFKLSTCKYYDKTITIISKIIYLYTYICTIILVIVSNTCLRNGPTPSARFIQNYYIVSGADTFEDRFPLCKICMRLLATIRQVLLYRYITCPNSKFNCHPREAGLFVDMPSLLDFSKNIDSQKKSYKI